MEGKLRRKGRNKERKKREGIERKSEGGLKIEWVCKKKEES